MLLEIDVATEHMGDVLTDLSARKGQIKNIADKGAVQVITALVPLAQLFGYATAVRSLTRGRASYTMEPHYFAPVSDATQRQLMNA